MVLDTSLLNTQRYKVRIKGKVEESRERISVRVVAIEKGAFWSPSTTVVNFTNFINQTGQIWPTKYERLFQ